MKSNAKKFLALFLCICMLMSGTVYAQENAGNQALSTLEEQGMDSSAEGEKTESGKSENTEVAGDVETNETNLENQEAESNAAELQTESTEQNGAVTADGVEINEANFPDIVFREYVGRFDINKNGTLSESELNAVKRMDVDGYGGKGIHNLTGIEYFASLTELYCTGKGLDELDVSKNINLTRLDCSHNSLTVLDVSKNVNLTRLDCSYNDKYWGDPDYDGLTVLDVSKNVNLTYLNCEYSELKELDVSKNVNLTKMECNSNNLAVLNVSRNMNLTHLNCSDNELKNLDVSRNVELTKLECNDNHLTALDISKNLKLSSLDCSGNDLATLDVSKSANLTWLDCSGNRLNNLDVRNCAKLSFLDVQPLEKENVQYSKEPTVFFYGCDNADGVRINAENFPDIKFRNRVEAFDANSDGTLSESEINVVTKIDCGGSDLAGIEYFTSLTHLNCGGSELKRLDISKNINLTRLSCTGSDLPVLDVSKNVNLTYLECDRNELKGLDVSKNVKLRYLDCDCNKLKNLDVSKNVNLTVLECRDNELTALDVSKNVNLYTLWCNDNKLKVLDVSQNTELYNFYCHNNQLKVLDTSNLRGLSTFCCSNNQLESLDMSKSLGLFSLDCSNNRLKTLDVSKNKSLYRLDCSNNKLKFLDVRSCTIPDLADSSIPSRLNYLDVRPLPKSSVKYKNRPATFLYGSDNPGHWNPYIDIFTKTDPAKVKPETGGIDLEAIYKLFGIGDTTDIEVIVEQKDAGFSYQKRLTDHAAKFGDKILKIYDVVMNLYKDGRYNTAITDNFGRLTLSFYAGKEYAGKTAVVYQLHGTSEVIPYRDLTIDENGMVTITVSKLSTFAVALQGSGANTSPKTGDPANMAVWIVLAVLAMSAIPITIGRKQRR